MNLPIFEWFCCQCPLINYLDYQCKLKQQLSKHMKNHEDPENRKYKCDICGKGFLSNQKLREHILTHANIKAYKCEFCSQAFSNFSGHRQHMMRKVHGILLPKLFWPTVRKIVLVIMKNFWNSRLKAENLQTFWDH